MQHQMSNQNPQFSREGKKKVDSGMKTASIGPSLLSQLTVNPPNLANQLNPNNNPNTQNFILGRNNGNNRLPNNNNNNNNQGVVSEPKGLKLRDPVQIPPYLQNPQHRNPHQPQHQPQPQSQSQGYPQNHLQPKPNYEPFHPSAPQQEKSLIESMNPQMSPQTIYQPKNENVIQRPEMMTLAPQSSLEMQLQVNPYYRNQHQHQIQVQGNLNTHAQEMAQISQMEWLESQNRNEHDGWQMQKSPVDFSMPDQSAQGQRICPVDSS
jgi:hypothetical protein